MFTVGFTAFMANQAAPIWQTFCNKVGIHLTPCPSTSLYPPFDGSVAPMSRRLFALIVDWLLCYVIASSVVFAVGAVTSVCVTEVP